MTTTHLPVGKLLKLRQEKLGAGLPFDDGCKLGLAVEGGGMRGVVSGAMLIAIEDLGLKNVFDAYYGTSSGSLNLAYFLAGWRWDALRMYYDYLAVRDFVDVLRPLKSRRPIVNMALLFDSIMAEELPLDYDKVVSARPQLHVAVSSIDEAVGIVKSDFATGDELRDYLRAGAWLPLLAGRPLELNGRRYLDGGVYFPSPMYVAQRDECTHTLSLTTRPEGPGRTKPALWQGLLARRLNHWMSGAGDSYLQGIRRYIADRNSIGFGETSLDEMRVLRLAVPTDGHEVSRLTTGRGVLLTGARAGYMAVLNELGGGPVSDLPFSLGRNE